DGCLVNVQRVILFQIGLSQLIVQEAHSPRVRQRQAAPCWEGRAMSESALIASATMIGAALIRGSGRGAGAGVDSRRRLGGSASAAISRSAAPVVANSVAREAIDSASRARRVAQAGTLARSRPDDAAS